MSCDEAVLRKFGNQIKKDYSTSLLAMAAGRKISHRISPAFAEGSTESRIHNVLKYKKPTVVLIGAAVVVSVVAAVFLLGNPANASEEPEAYVHHAIVTEVTEWQNQKDGSTVVSLLLSNGYTVTIGEDTAVEPYFEFDMSQGIKAGDLVRITFPKGEEVLVLETYPARFSKSPELIEVMGRGFSIERVDSAQHLYKFAVPLGMAREACPGDQLEIWHYPDVDLYLDPYIGQEQEPELFASVPVLEVDESKFDVWVQLSEEQVDIFMQEFGFGVFCTVIKSGDGQGSDPEKDGVFVEDVPLQTLSAEILRSGRIPDGEYLVQVYSLSEYERVIDRYRVDGWDSGEELPKLTFSTVCYHWVCEEAGSGNYVARDLQDFVLETMEELEKGDVSLRLEFKEGLIVSAYMSRAAEQ